MPDAVRIARQSFHRTSRGGLNVANGGAVWVRGACRRPSASELTGEPNARFFHEVASLGWRRGSKVCRAQFEPLEDSHAFHQLGIS